MLGLEMFHKHLDHGEAGDQLGALLRGIKRDEVKRGMVVCEPGTVKAHIKVKAQVSIILDPLLYSDLSVLSCTAIILTEIDSHS